MIILIIDLYDKFVFLIIGWYIRSMLSMTRKKMIWVILLWFAILQTMSPLIHAHLEGDRPELGHGIHMHADDIAQIQDKVPTLRSNLGVSDIVGIDKGVVQNFKYLPLPLLVFLFVISSNIIICQVFNPIFVFKHFRPLYLRTNAAPRSPPYF